ncbi:MAG: Gfo/Idh/MocA family oxidoreductase [candidate division KSB1 bacterium]|nr:Gfo/Idh/MocA family oxidoreductase [candidate division KSB1 bacterium]
MNIAVVGLGYWGPNLVRNIYEAKMCSGIYCCDKDPAKTKTIKTKYPEINITNNYKDILNNQDIEAVVIATPVSTHYPLGLEFLNAGKHVFIEKPFAASTEQANELVNTAEKRNKVIMVGHTFEYSPPVLKIKELIDKNELGDIYYISSSRVNLGLHQKDVSVIWDLAPHDFSCLFFWLNEDPIRISAMGKDYVQKGIPDVAFINLEFPSGSFANVQVSWLAPSKLRRTAIIGSEKMLVYDDTQNVEKVKIYDKGVDYVNPESFGEFQLSYRTGDIISPRLETFEPLNREMQHFVNCCKTGKTPISDGRDGLRVVKALESAEYSLNHNGESVEI